MRCVIWTLLGFLSGSVLYSYNLPKHIRGVDVTARSADGNPGVSNVFKYAGVGLGIVCLLLDIGKGAVPVYLALPLPWRSLPLQGTPLRCSIRPSAAERRSR